MTTFVPDPLPVRLGLMSPFTGLVGLYGEEIARAARLACAEVNAQGGVLGRPLELVIEDDGSLPGTAVAAAGRLLEQGCAALVGNLLSNARIAVAHEVADVHGVPYLNFSFYEGSIHSRHFFHFAALPNQQIGPMITALAERAGPKMYFAGSNYEWPLGSIDLGKQALLDLGGEVVGEEYPPLGGALVDDLLDRVERSGADVFVPYFAGEEQLRVLNGFAERGLKQRMAVVMGHYDEAMASRLAPAVRGGFYSCNTYFMSIENSCNQRTLAALAALPEIDAPWPRGRGILTHFGEGAWLCVHAFAQAANQAGALDSTRLIPALEQVELQGPQGLVRMDPVTHHAAVNTYLARSLSDGTFEILQHFSCLRPMIPERYRIAPEPASPRHASRGLQEAARLLGRMAFDVKPRGHANDTRTARHGNAELTTTAACVLSIADVAVISTTEEGTILDANRRASEIFGYAPGELCGRPIHDLVPPRFRAVHAQHLHHFRTGPEDDKRMAARMEVSGYRKDGALFPAEASIARFRIDGSLIFVVTVNDLTERHADDAALRWQGLHDVLTGLPNQVLLRERISSALRRSEQLGDDVGLLLIELDGLKQIDDTFGDAGGDELLRVLSQRLMASSHSGDTIAHTGRCEFAILRDRVSSQTALVQLAEQLIRGMREPLTLLGHQVYVTANIGIASGRGGALDSGALLRQAEGALAAARAQGQDGWRCYDAEMSANVQRKRQLSHRLRSALEHQEFQVRFQPILSNDSLLVCGAEVLLRWFPPDGEISPGLFIPIAEANGLIRPIGRWVMREACLAEAAWRARFGAEAPYVSVNLSPRQLDERNLVDDFRAILAETGADPTRLLLEVTETALMHDVATNVEVLNALADLGPRIAVDDFGTGYSSLVQLLRLPISTLKIDREFIAGLGQPSQCEAIVSAICGLAKAMGLKTIAEGVENQDQLDYLRDVGCDGVQGFYLHRPLTGDALLQAVEDRTNPSQAAASRDLYQVLYVSMAKEDLNSDDLEGLMVRAREFNRSQGITGFLVHYNGSFLQILEGQRERLQRLLATIRADPRHHRFKLVFEGPIERRALKDWSMGFRTIDGSVLPDGVADVRAQKLSFYDLAQDPDVCRAIIMAFSK
ncbi:diguanylate cyclase [Thiocapsa imhoffii]|uniref:Diguanylate cyclase n=1 Tax=Thiocapsa imhoffii TaxID=382777 RepID=A0A9X0WKN7_9GAMM|nr:EAL domain-containing protein [Thiocapsa imhoffii]MBK1646527.1 diguanylate cyclase [Thiocapsa imhoffii]